MLGFGIVAYLDILYTMIWMFALFSVMMIPAFIFYDAGTTYENINPKAVKYANRTIGNLGYAGVYCYSIPLDVGELDISCAYGTIGEIKTFGVNPDKDSRGYCVNEAEKN